MVRNICIGALWLLAMNVSAQQNDAVLMSIAGKNVSVSEFLHSYSKNRAEYEVANSSEKSAMADYLKSYVVFRLKLAAAEKLGLDASSDFKEKMQGLSEIQKPGIAGYATTKQISNKNIHLKVGDIFVPLNQHASPYEQNRLRTKMDSAYAAVKSGADFQVVARKLGSKGRSLYWLQPNETLVEFESKVFSLNEGEVSLPFLSTDGFHIVKLYEKRPAGTELTMDVREEDGNKEGNGTFESVNPLSSDDSQKLEDYKNGLLVSEAYMREVEAKAETDERALSRYFEEHVKQYEWDVPRYKGMVYHCKDKKVVKKVYKLLKKYPMSQWSSVSKAATNKKLFENVQLGEVRLYKLSENPFVDALVFGGPKVAPLKDYPYVGVVGHEQKKYPESYTEVKELVVSDYCNHLEQEWVKSLRNRFTVSINEKEFKKISSNK